MKRELYLSAFLGIAILIYSLFSCIQSTNKNSNSIEDIDDKEKVEKYEVFIPEFNIYRFKSQLDSLLSIIEYKNFQFQLDIDTVSEKSDSKIDWHFGKWGLFKLINSKEASQLIFYHFFEPKTTKILRIYLIEASYNDSIFFNKIHKSFLKEKNKEKMFAVDDEGKEYYFDSGLTTLNDYVIILKNKIYWLNLSSQYSRKNFDKIIDYFKDNLNEKNYLDTLKSAKRPPAIETEDSEE
jgi:hypothetical protein